MATSDDDFDIDLLDLRALVAQALKTSDAPTLDQAERDYRGLFPSVHAYLMHELSTLSEPQLLALYETHTLTKLWTIQIPEGLVLFASTSGPPPIKGPSSRSAAT